MKPSRPGDRRPDHRRTAAARPATEGSQAPLPPIADRLILGQQCVREAIRVWGTAVRRVYVERDPGPRVAALKKFADDQAVSVETVSRASLDRLAGGSIHQGVAADAPALRLVDWDELMKDPQLVAVALDGVVDPQNFGAVIRSAVGIGNAAIIWPESASAPLTPSTFRASAGAIEHARLCRVRSLHGALSEAAMNGTTVLGLAPEADEVLGNRLPDGPIILVIGSEQKGMGRAVRKACTHLVRLHQSGLVQSLNASVAAGIALHQVISLRAQSAPPSSIQ
jgi:23S rRNA (guanosine2251-2'-O)-methyltransferase